MTCPALRYWAGRLAAVGRQRCRGGDRLLRHLVGHGDLSHALAASSRHVPQATQSPDPSTVPSRRRARMQHSPVGVS